MSDRVMLVTGASSGIGKSCADRFHNRGWTVYGASRGIKEAGAHAHPTLSMDVTSDESVVMGVRRIVDREGRIDAVINCAGIAIAGAVEDTSISEAKAQLETNFFGVVRVCHAVLPIMRQQRAGALIMISSLAGLTALPFQAYYSASKFALEGMTEALRMEVMPFGIRVVLIEPGNFSTEVTASRTRTVASSSNRVYRGNFERSLALIEEAEIGGSDPVLVAKLVERVLSDPSPNLRYTVGLLPERLAVSLKKLLPYKLYERLAMRVLGVSRR